MSNGFGTYAFLPWLRRGVSTGINRQDFDNRNPGASDFARATLSVSVSVTGAPAGVTVEGLALYGPGEVTGFDPRVVVRTWPRPDVYDVESNYFPLIEFGQPDLPWRYTPASPNAADRLRPWFCLIALTDGEYELETAGMAGPDQPLTVLKIKSKAPLPKLSQAWAWAHVQVTGEQILDPTRDTDLNKVRKYLTDEPQRIVARLLCPRRLDPKTAYTVFVVPIFERGRLAGLGKQKADQELSKRPTGQTEWKDIDALETSWADNEADASTTKLRGREIELPVYYSWRFGTGLGGDFEYLVSLLQKKELPHTVGIREMDVQNPGAGLPKASEVPLGLEGALKAPAVESTWGKADMTTRNIWTARFTELLNKPIAMLTKNTKVHVLSSASRFQQFVYQKRTALPETDDTFTFALADWDGDGIPDLIAIKKSKTDSNSTEVHILSGKSNFQEFILQTGTPLPETDDTWTFIVADMDHDGRPDLLAIKKRKTSTGLIEFAILSGAKEFQSIIRGETALPESDDYDFCVGDWDGDERLDLIAIKKRNTHKGNVEVEILSDASDFRQSIFKGITTLPESDDYNFCVGDWDGDGRPDLIAIKYRDTISNNTEVLVLSDASDFQDAIFSGSTALPETDNAFVFAVTDWDQDGKPDLVVIEKCNTATSGNARRVTLPLYGRWHAARDTIARNDPKATPPWFDDLNIDPRLRVAAGLGTYVVQTQQQELMASAWRQVEGIRKINNELRQAQLAREVATRVFERHIAVQDDESVLSVTAPVQGRVLHIDSTTSETKTIKAWLGDSPIAEGIFEAQWRRVARPLGPLGRRQGRAGLPRESDLLERLNWGETPLYRLLNPNNGDHFYTTSAVERDNAIANFGYIDEGIACYVYASQTSRTVSLYRLLHSSNGDHFYTTSAVERDNAIKSFGFIDEGIACYVYASQTSGTVSLYRLLHPSNGDHFYTTSAAERDNLIKSFGFIDEGIACYVFKVSRLSPATPPPTPSRISTFAGAGLDLASIPVQFGAFPGPDDQPREYNPDERDDERTYVFKEPTDNIDPAKLGTGKGWNVFGHAAKELFDQLKQTPAPALTRHKVNITELRDTLVKELNPHTTIESSYKNRLQETKGATWRQGNDPLGQVMAAPEFPQPMFEPLRDLSQDWLLPGLDKVPPNTMSLLGTNERFVEAYMVGLNHEMARELLWNGYPTDQRGSYFRQFWDPSSYLMPNGTLPDPTKLKDIDKINDWKKALGENNNPQNTSSGDKLVLLIRGELLRRYPNALLYATKATYKNNQRDLTNEQDSDFEERHPLFSGTFKPDVSFFAFKLTEKPNITQEDEARGCLLNPDGTPVSKKPEEQGWYFVLKEQPSETRFGLNAANKDNTGAKITKWDDLSWGHLADTTAATEADVEKVIADIHYIDLEAGRPLLSTVSSFENPKGLQWHAAPPQNSRAADIAVITLQGPVRVAVHASDMLP